MKTKRWILAVVLPFLVLGLSNCKKGGTQDIAGDNSKIWKVAKITDSDGDREKLDRDEKNDQMQFYTDGTFTANSKNEHSRGTWTHDAGKNTLSLQFENATISQNYEIVELNNDRMRLKAGDGSELIMEAAD